MYCILRYPSNYEYSISCSSMLHKTALFLPYLRSHAPFLRIRIISLVIWLIRLIVRLILYSFAPGFLCNTMKMDLWKPSTVVNLILDFCELAVAEIILGWGQSYGAIPSVPVVLFLFILTSDFNISAPSIFLYMTGFTLSTWNSSVKNTPIYWTIFLLQYCVSSLDFMPPVDEQILLFYICLLCSFFRFPCFFHWLVPL